MSENKHLVHDDTDLADVLGCNCLPEYFLISEIDNVDHFQSVDHCLCTCDDSHRVNKDCKSDHKKDGIAFTCANEDQNRKINDSFVSPEKISALPLTTDSISVQSINKLENILTKNTEIMEQSIDIMKKIYKTSMLSFNEINFHPELVTEAGKANLFSDFNGRSRSASIKHYSSANNERSGAMPIHASFGDPDIVDAREYNHQVIVEFKATFLKITDIDTISQQFEAEVFLQAKWEEIGLAGADSKTLTDLLPSDLWDPHLVILNATGDFDNERRSFVVRYEEGYESPVVLHRWRFKGLFRESLELRHFPFDVQDLTLQVSTERAVDEIYMMHDQRHLSSVATKTFQDSQEWNIYRHVECKQETTNQEYASAVLHPILTFSCRVRRKVYYYLWNIIFIVFLVIILSAMATMIDPVTPDRLASTMTLFLTMVAFKLVVKQSLPTISYLTYLDLYILGSMMYLVLVAMENSMMLAASRWADHQVIADYDNFFNMTLVVGLTLFHLLFIVHIQITALKRHRVMEQHDRQYKCEMGSLSQSYELILNV